MKEERSSKQIIADARAKLPTVAAHAADVKWRTAWDETWTRFPEEHRGWLIYEPIGGGPEQKRYWEGHRVVFRLEGDRLQELTWRLVELHRADEVREERP